MRGLVLASGKGVRLGTPRGRTKPLVHVAGLPLLKRAARNLIAAGVDEIVVVIGYRADEVRRFCIELSARLEVPIRCVYNDSFEQGNGLAVLAAESEVGNEPFLLIMADHVLDPAILEALVTSTPPPGGAVLAVDHAVEKHGVDLSDVTRVEVRGGLVRRIGKGVDPFNGFDTGAFLCTTGVFDALRGALAHGDTALSAGMQRLADRDRLASCDVTGQRWVDVDTRRDLRRASQMLLGRGGKPADGLVARCNRVLSTRVVTPLLLAMAPGISPNAVSVLSAVTAFAAAASILAGWLLAAAVLVQLASIVDGCDGEIARVADRRSRYGAFLDPVLDRIVDGVLVTAAGCHLSDRTGSLIPVAIAGLAAVGHLVVSYTTARARLDLGHSYTGRFFASGRGRDVRLAVLTAGLAASVLHPAFLLAALTTIAATSWFVVAGRLIRSRYASELAWADVDAVLVDFDGTIADSMPVLTEIATEVISEELGLDERTARCRYLASTGTDFATQLLEIAPEAAPLHRRAVHRFETAKRAAMEGVVAFADVQRFLDDLRSCRVAVGLCSSTDRAVVIRWLENRGLISSFDSVDGWSPGRDKLAQLRDSVIQLEVEPHRCLFIGDSRRDGELAASLGIRFRGVLRQATSNLAGSGLRYSPDLLAIGQAIRRRRRLGVVDQQLESQPVPPVTHRRSPTDGNDGFRLRRGRRSHAGPAASVPLRTSGLGTPEAGRGSRETRQTVADHPPEERAGNASPSLR